MRIVYRKPINVWNSLNKQMLCVWSYSLQFHSQVIQILYQYDYENWDCIVYSLHDGNVHLYSKYHMIYINTIWFCHSATWHRGNHASLLHAIHSFRSCSWSEYELLSAVLIHRPPRWIWVCLHSCVSKWTRIQVFKLIPLWHFQQYVILLTPLWHSLHSII